MCVICYKPEGKKLPSKKKIKTMFYNNPDGAGLMYADGERVYIKKGLMTLSEFNTELNKLRARAIDIPVVMHFRITTHGATSKGLTHPFALSDNADILTATETTADVGIAHNGIIPMTSYARSLSDTAEFIRRYATRLFKDGIDADALAMCEELIKSKFCVLESDKSAHLLGEFMQDGNGVYYSNDSYKPRQKIKAKTSYNLGSFWDNKETYSYVNNHYCAESCDICKYESDCYMDWSDGNPYSPTAYHLPFKSVSV